MPIRVVLADDHPLTRAGISAYLAQESSVELVGKPWTDRRHGG